MNLGNFFWVAGMRPPLSQGGQRSAATAPAPCPPAPLHTKAELPPRPSSLKEMVISCLHVFHGRNSQTISSSGRQAAAQTYSRSPGSHAHYCPVLQRFEMPPSRSLPECRPLGGRRGWGDARQLPACLPPCPPASRSPRLPTSLGLLKPPACLHLSWKVMEGMARLGAGRHYSHCHAWPGSSSQRQGSSRLSHWQACRQPPPACPGIQAAAWKLQPRHRPPSVTPPCMFGG